MAKTNAAAIAPLIFNRAAHNAMNPHVNIPSNGEITAPPRSRVCPRSTLLALRSNNQKPRSNPRFVATIAQSMGAVV